MARMVAFPVAGCTKLRAPLRRGRGASSLGALMRARIVLTSLGFFWVTSSLGCTDRGVSAADGGMGDAGSDAGALDAAVLPDGAAIDAGRTTDAGHDAALDAGVSDPEAIIRMLVCEP